MIRTWIQGAAAAVTLGAGLALVPAAPSSAAPRPVIPTGSDSITVLSQSPWVSSGKDFRLRLRITASHPADTALGVLVFPRLTTRTAFDDDLAGHLNAYASYQPPIVKLSKLPADPAGGVDVDIPVNASAPSGGAFPELFANPDSGVFPLQVGLYNTSGTSIGSPVTTFLVFAQGPPSVTGLPRLSVGVVLPLHAAPTIGPGGQVQVATASQSAALGGLVDVLAQHPRVPISLEVTPQTLDALSSGGADAHATLNDLEQVVRGGPDQVLPAPYVALSMNDMQASGLGGEVTTQLQQGSQVLAKDFGRAPATTAWAINGPVDPDVVNDLVGRGATELILPDADMTPFPPAAQILTFAYPTRLVGPGVPPSSKVNVFAADTGLTADFNNTGGPVLAASQLLAEMVIIQLEQPGNPRGVAVVPPAGWAENPTFINTLLAGLDGHPLLQAVTASGLFAHVAAPSTGPVERSLASAPTQAALASPASGSGSAPASGPAGTRDRGSASSAAPTPASNVGADAETIRAARVQLQGLASFAPTEQQTLKSLQLQLLVSESSDLTEGQRQTLLGAVTGAANKVLGHVSLPHASSITLTSTRGEIPLTILSSAPLRVHVQLQLTSERLLFHAFNPPGGHCEVPTSTTEVCDLTLVTHNTTLKVPVETRSSGVFPLDVALRTPDGSLALAFDNDTVRSTAVSDVGIVLIVLAVVSLAVWWGRDLRHGRRARRLVPAPSEDEAAQDSAVVVDLKDPVVTGFFATPPPAYDQPPPVPRGP